MRKAIFTTLMVAFGLVAMAQQAAVEPDGRLKGLEKTIRLTDQENPVRAGAALTEPSDWYGWWGDWAAFEGGFRQQSSFFVMYPDTDLVNLFLDDNTNTTNVSSVAWCSVGQGFDPKDQAWSDPDVPGVRDWFGYTLDSGFVRYGYFRQNPDETIVDTLIVQVFANIGNGGQLINGVFTSDQSRFAIPRQDRRRGAVGASPSYEVKIPLDGDDSTQARTDGSFSIKTISWGINEGNGIQIQPGQVAHMTLSFKPGQQYNLGDTLYFDPDLANFGETPPVKQLNRFGVIVSTQTPNISPLTSFNNGSFIVRWNRYEDPDNIAAFMRGAYYPNRFGGNGTSFAYYPQIAYHFSASYDPTDVGELDPNGYGLGNVFPNPVSNNASFTFSLGNAEQVNVSVFDMTGKKIVDLENGEFAQGEHTVNFSTQDMESGMYIYTITAGDFTKSATFNVVK